MKCPNCGSIFQEGFICPDCNIDTFIFKKTRNLSIRLYNQALEKAYQMDLSGAIEDLEQSITFDKNNIQARNLLGLLYAEMGKMANALVHWIFSSSVVKEGNPATGYMSYLKKNGREMEKYNDAIVLYNQALYYLKHGSDDLAIIQLKKSLDINPDLVDAYNLMILCCIEDNNVQRAQHFIDLVLKKDAYNPTALRYAKYIGLPTYASNSNRRVERSRPVKENSTIISNKKTDGSPTIPKYRRKEKTSGLLAKRDIIAFALGVVISVIVLMVLIVPANNESKDNLIAELQSQVDIYSGETNMTPEEVLELRATASALEDENKLLRSEETKQANMELLQTAVSQLSDEDYEACVTTLDKIDTFGFGEEDLAKYNSVKVTAYPKAAESLYTQGKSDFLNNNYDDAQLNLEASLKYAENDNFIDDTYYYLGKIDESNGYIDSAREYYQKIISGYPDSNQLANAENAIGNLPAVE
ncbi:tetratricopeptide repeat protein [Chakrabartyella piscis]|uniref:tetratricopeptide repeat protein n=1 Tax=Chakrabartyella piscis TaxID=2918914 RepID=UPI0029583708|nr:tetratricopeptide repeat protein [Chakrabartyella piscis]